MKRILLRAGIISVLLALPLGACTTVAQWTANAAQSLSSTSSTQVSTYADAVLAADAVTKLADAAVNTGKLNRAQLETIQSIRGKVRAAYEQLKAANDAGQSLDFAAINEALVLWSSYATAQGIAH